MEHTWEKFLTAGEQEEFGTFAGRTARFYNMLYDHIMKGKELEVKIPEVRKQIAIIEECHKQNPLDKFVDTD